MNEDELTEAVLAAHDVLKVETLDAYADEGDDGHLERYVRGDPKPDPSEKAAWLNLLRSAADRGHPWKWLRVVTRPVPEYVRYACEFGYVDNVEVGHVDLRVLDAARFNGDLTDGLRRFGDVYVLDGQLIAMQFKHGTFVRADRIDHDIDGTLASVQQTIKVAWARAIPFTEWWSANPDLHRTLATR